jgi:hypothetical protein
MEGGLDLEEVDISPGVDHAPWWDFRKANCEETAECTACGGSRDVDAGSETKLLSSITEAGFSGQVAATRNILLTTSKACTPGQERCHPQRDQARSAEHKATLCSE